MFALSLSLTLLGISQLIMWFDVADLRQRIEDLEDGKP